MILFVVLLYISWIRLSGTKNLYRILIITIRVLILFLIIPLIQNKIFKDNKSITEQQNFGVIIDNSSSIKKIIDSDKKINIDEIIFKIEDWGNDKNINLSWYDLDSIILPRAISFDRKSTSFDLLEELLINNKENQLFLISDGNINEGIFLNDVYSNSKRKIHTIGLGDSSDGKQNIKINDFKIELINDSIHIKSECSANINQLDRKIAFNIFTDSSKTQIYTDTLVLSKGQYNFDKNIRLNSSIIKNNLFFILEALNFSDEKIHDNKWDIRLTDFSSKKLLFITGRLSYNSTFLKKIFLKNSFHYDLIQITYINDNEELDIKGDLTDYDYIILDNFPNTNKQINLLNSIKVLDIPVIFFEGHGFNPDYIQKMLNIYHPNKFYIEDSKYQNESKISKKFNLDNHIDMGPVYSNYNLFSIDSLFTKIYYFSNNSVAAIVSQNFSSFFIPNISEISFFMNTNYNSNYIEKYIEYILNTNSDDKELMNFKLKKNNYMIGENLLFKVNKNDIPFDILESKLIIQNMTTETIE